MAKRPICRYSPVVDAAVPGRETPYSTFGLSLENLPVARFGGYERDAVRHLLDEAAATYSRLRRAHEAVQAELEDARRQHDEALRARDEASAATTAQEQASTGLLEEAKREHARLRTELDSLRSQLKRLEVDLHEERERGVARENELEVAERELASYKRREVVLTEMIASSKRVAERMRREARIEADKVLKKARRREEAIMRGVRAEVRAQEQERDLMRESADELRAELSSILASTLERLAVDSNGNEGRDPSPGEETLPRPLKARRTRRRRAARTSATSDGANGAAS